MENITKHYQNRFERELTNRIKYGKGYFTDLKKRSELAERESAKKSNRLLFITLLVIVALSLSLDFIVFA